MTSKPQEKLPVGILKKTLEEALCMADIVTLHCPQTAETTGMINRERLAQMKHGAILINTARGGVVDEQAVADALQTGHLGAYAADVLSQEPPSPDCPLLQAPRAFLTPHIAWASFEARIRLLNVCQANVAAFVKGQPINVVNE